MLFHLNAVEMFGIFLVVLGGISFSYGCYVCPGIYRWTDCDHDTETWSWSILKGIFGFSLIFIAVGVYCLFEVSLPVFLALLLLSPLSIILLRILKKA